MSPFKHRTPGGDRPSTPLDPLVTDTDSLFIRNEHSHSFRQESDFECHTAYIEDLPSTLTAQTPDRSSFSDAESVRSFERGPKPFNSLWRRAKSASFTLRNSHAQRLSQIRLYGSTVSSLSCYKPAEVPEMSRSPLSKEERDKIMLYCAPKTAGIENAMALSSYQPRPPLKGNGTFRDSLPRDLSVPKAAREFHRVQCVHLLALRPPTGLLNPQVGGRPSAKTRAPRSQSTGGFLSTHTYLHPFEKHRGPPTEPAQRENSHSHPSGRSARKDKTSKKVRQGEPSSELPYRL